MAGLIKGAIARAQTLNDGVERLVVRRVDLATERFRHAEVRLERDTLAQSLADVLDVLTDATPALDCGQRGTVDEARRALSWAHARQQAREASIRGGTHP